MFQQNETTMKNLIDILTTETQSLKEQYIQFTSEWANQEFYRLKQWIKDYCVWERENCRKKEMRNEYFKKQKISWSIPRDVYENKIEQFVEKQIKNAEEHYTQSIAKLALRIEQKQLNINNLKAVTSHIGMNIDTTLTDGEKVVRAFTIIANGEINRPHYRYLIK